MPFQEAPNPTPAAEPGAQGPYRLLTVNTTPERAFRLIGRVTSALATKYTIVHIGNVDSIADVESTVAKLQPDIVFSASMWTAQEVEELQADARRAKPDVVLHAIPQGLQVERGPDAVVEYLLERAPDVVRAVEMGRERN